MSDDFEHSGSRNCSAAERQCWTHIGRHQPDYDREWECQCARCGSSLGFEICDACGGDGFVEEEDYDEIERCGQCNGKQGYSFCLSSDEYCDENPMEGREDVKGSTPEWFTFEPPKDSGR